MNTPAPGLHIPLTVTYDGTPVLLETQDHLRTLRAFLDTWIGIYDKAEKLPQLPQGTPTQTPTQTEVQEATDAPCEPLTAAHEATEGQEASTEADAAEAASVENSDVAENLPKRTLHYMVQALQAHGGSLPTETLYEHMRGLGWSTSSPNMQAALRNLENTARKYKEVVTVASSTIRLVTPD